MSNTVSAFFLTVLCWPVQWSLDTSRQVTQALSNTSLQTTPTEYIQVSAFITLIFYIV